MDDKEDLDFRWQHEHEVIEYAWRQIDQIYSWIARDLAPSGWVLESLERSRGQILIRYVVGSDSVGVEIDNDWLRPSDFKSWLSEALEEAEKAAQERAG